MEKIVFLKEVWKIQLKHFNNLKGPCYFYSCDERAGFSLVNVLPWSGSDDAA